VRVAAGSTIPVDGVLLDATCRVDEALISGESKPLARQRGDAVIAGSMAIDGPVLIEVQRIGADTVLAGIVRMVTRAAGERPRLARLADARAARFVIRVLILTALTAIVWAVLDPSRAFPAALAVLVVSCPCAFALAVPAALTRAVSVLARRGVLVVDADALESLSNANHFVFDKTGTLTEPRVDLAKSHVSRGSLEAALTVAAALEQGSTHPMAMAIRRAAGDRVLPPVAGLRHIASAGVEGEIDGRHYRFGLRSYSLSEAPATEAVSEEQATSLVLADADGEIARFVIEEEPRVGVVATIDALRASGMGCEILSGDAPSRAEAMAKRLGVAEWTASAKPETKLARLLALREQGKVVAMVGDGVNDAPVLAAADVALAIGDGSTLAHAASGILLGAGRVDVIVEARDIARRMQTTLRQNLNWAFGYNLSIVPLAAMGWIPPWLAALGMSLSSIVVILNSLRIGRERAAPAAAPSTLEVV
jgi:Cu2+-exporting ATPase